MTKLKLNQIWHFLIESKLSLVLTPISLIYFIITQVRYELYRKGIFKRHTPKIRTICIGNISLGGNGKTPVTLYLATMLMQHKYKISILSRGHGGLAFKSPHLISKFDAAEITGDESIIYRDKFNQIDSTKDIHVVVSKDRIKGINLLNSIGTSLILLDDGYQHFRIKPQISLCLIDINDADLYLKNPIFSIFPSGVFREHPASGLKRADRIVFIKRGVLSEIDKANIIQITQKFEIKKYSTLLIKSDCLKDGYNDNIITHPRESTEIVTLTSIAKPRSFNNNLESLGYKIKKSYIYPDHYNFSETEVRTIFQQNQGITIICTYKDLVKIKPWIDQAGRLFYLDQKIEDLNTGEDNLLEWLQMQGDSYLQ